PNLRSPRLSDFGLTPDGRLSRGLLTGKGRSGQGFLDFPLGEPNPSKYTPGRIQRFNDILRDGDELGPIVLPSPSAPPQPGAVGPLARPGALQPGPNAPGGRKKSTQLEIDWDNPGQAKVPGPPVPSNKGSNNPNTQGAALKGTQLHLDKPGNLPDQLR